MCRGICEQGLSGVRIMPEKLAGSSEAERLACELGAEAIMQITAQTTTLFLPRRDKPLTRTLQISGKTDSIDSNPRMSSEIIQQPVVGSSEGFAMHPWNEEQFTDHLSLIDERQAELRLQSRPVGRCNNELVTLLQRNSGIR